MLDCSPLTDGAAATVLVSDRIASRFERPVSVFGSSQASDTLALYRRKSITEMAATGVAAKSMWEQTGLSPRDIDVLEVHDCFSINEIMALEDLGFCEKGCGGKFVENGGILLDGEIPTNTAGGLKAIGHPVGATGVRQICDVVRQIRGDAFNQIDAEIGLTMNVGGVGGTVILHMLGKKEI
jgi:acetyl-CoA C-acetyltransferase